MPLKNAYLSAWILGRYDLWFVPYVTSNLVGSLVDAHFDHDASVRWDCPIVAVG